MLENQLDRADRSGVTAYQVYIHTEMWWYQCRKGSGDLRRTMKAVSPNSTILERTKIQPHKATLLCFSEIVSL